MTNSRFPRDVLGLLDADIALSETLDNNSRDHPSKKIKELMRRFLDSSNPVFQRMKHSEKRECSIKYFSDS